jgi:hypothetical protein
MNNVAALDKDLNEQILSGKAMEGFEQYYADDVVMQENSDKPFAGKDVNRKREIEFFSSLAEFHGAKLLASAVADDTSFGQWWIDVTMKNGSRVTMEQVAVRKWKNGKIAHERFFYNRG